MKTIRLVARQMIYDPSLNTIHDDQGLSALNGIRFGKCREIEDETALPALWLEMKQEFETENPDFRGARYSIRYEDGTETACF